MRLHGGSYARKNVVFFPLSISQKHILQSSVYERKTNREVQQCQAKVYSFYTRYRCSW